MAWGLAWGVGLSNYLRFKDLEIYWITSNITFEIWIVQLNEIRWVWDLVKWDDSGIHGYHTLLVKWLSWFAFQYIFSSHYLGLSLNR